MYVCKRFEGGGDGSWRDDWRRRRGVRKESKRKKRREKGEAGCWMLDAGFGGRSPLRAISGRAVFHGSQNGRHPHQVPPLG